MLLSEILGQVDTMVPNALSASIKIQWINQVQNELYRDFPVPEGVAVFDTLKDQAAYTLPSDCAEERIRALLINGEEYPFIPVTDVDNSGYGKFWTTVVTGDILLNPTPDAVYKGVLYYKPRPRQLTENDMNVKPIFPEDFHELLVLGCAARVAKTKAETLGQASMFESDFLRLSERAAYKVLIGRRARQMTKLRSWS